MKADVTIDMGKRCAECGMSGVVPSGICLRCTTKALRGDRMKSWQGREVQMRFERKRRQNEI
jgi:hypothetical protein